MRIVAGRFRGRALTPVGKGDAAAHLRPTTDRVRESLFSILTSRGAIDGARVLDLFAGTGALGFEALSRGAESLCLVENGRKAQALIRDNIRLLDVRDEARLVARDATKLRPCDGPGFDLIFLDPPYGKSLGLPALDAARRAGWIAPGALIVFEENAPQEAPEGFALMDQRRFGDTHVTFLEPS
ncbi:MAG: 16S rRNA (guanine(966)-N(2))-methyltransferase RsmD [Rhodobacteraceae bacterium]|nr:16S rRNA (guanine(966)-N(2))-methyltransferase RsmD [Paracoccaceae bacterium]